jgi:signal transduction histidine kinase
MIKSPTLRLLLGLLVTLAAVAGFSAYTLKQLDGLAALQTETIDLNRHDSLLLLRVESDLNMIGLRLRDMTRQPMRDEIASYREEIDRLHADLQDAIDDEEKLAPATRRADQHAELIRALRQFWQSSDAVFAAANAGHEMAARSLASTRLFGQQAALAAKVSHLLERNNEAEQQADQKVASIYAGVERDIYAFLSATIVAILITSLYLIYSNRRTFEKMESLSRQRRILAARLITVQEEVLRSVSRELHDEFGQILTAVSAMLARAERKGVPPDSPLRTELTEVREITHNALEKVRSVSQMLHPAVIDDYGLVKGIEWYTDLFQKQTGIEASTEIAGRQVRITGQPAIHCFRIVQEALNNAAKHSGTKKAEVEMIFAADYLPVSVKDFGCGLPQTKRRQRGLGFIAMRERAELLGGSLEISSAVEKGTTVCLRMPWRPDDRGAEARAARSLEEAISPRN